MLSEFCIDVHLPVVSLFRTQTDFVILRTFVLKKSFPNLLTNLFNFINGPINSWIIMSRTFGRYTHAIVRHVPNSFVNAIGSTEPIDLRQARYEHANYVANLRDLGIYN